MIRAPRPAAQYTPQQAGMVRLTCDPDLAGDRPQRAVERTAAAR